ncbi:hypothetical protein [Streptomyces sp. NBC_01500]|uniref:hypothetical protein n=1 Tax=Streptomyces sp. NBC_01500 TaxID=2903886 RepID=UPI00225960B7|nr:hypothetical protein [Streptomyces sp. NBC_01500]MCX4553937.1 hypothetical protein [Streptomyces sp. NBC_01500]
MTQRPPVSGEHSGAAEGEPVLPDEVWVQFEQDSERAIRATAPKEPSARARMVTERLRQQDAAGIRPAGWRADPGPQRPRRAPRKRRRLLGLLGVLVAVGVVLVLLNPQGVLQG